MNHAIRLLGLFAALQADPVAAEAMKGYQHAWAGFGDGCSITAKETLRQPDIDPKGNLVYKVVTNEITTTVLAAAGEKTTLKIEGAGQESHIPFFTTLPSWTRGTGEKKGTESLTVGGVKHDCVVTVITLDADKDAGQRTTIWKAAGIPYWAAKWRTETLLQGKANTWEEDVVIEVNQKVKIGDREVTCVVVETTVEAVGGARTVRKEWRSDAIPGRVVRRESRLWLKGKEVESGYGEMEVVRFKGKR
jgi:hypothetical protein